MRQDKFTTRALRASGATPGQWLLIILSSTLIPSTFCKAVLEDTEGTGKSFLKGPASELGNLGASCRQGNKQDSRGFGSSK